MGDGREKEKLRITLRFGAWTFTEGDTLGEQVWRDGVAINWEGCFRGAGLEGEARDFVLAIWSLGCLLDLQVEVITQLTLQVWNLGERHTD